MSIETTLRALLDELRASQFADVQGAEAAVVLPVSDRLATRFVRLWLSQAAAAGPVQDLELHAEADDQFAVAIRLRQPAFLPPFTIRLSLEQQPVLPGQPRLVLRLRSQGLANLAGSLTRLLAKLPEGVTFEDGRIVVDILAFGSSQPSVPEVLRHLTVLELHAIPGRFVVTVRGALS